ncbi:MAG: ABC transporter permease subunit [Candidatus Ancillula trichonymphae]|jgi:NitT/TauT family transport system permease protein|nr:ABC transporter permease subunit [Candidatus Ancillula trichonymphae]
MTSSSRWTRTELKKLLYKLLGTGLVVLFWWFLSSSFAFTGMILSPVDTVVEIGKEMQHEDFWTSVFRTLFDALTSFSVGFVCAFSIAITALRFKNLRYILAPVITVLQSAPTIALIILFVLILPLELLTFAVSFLVIFPLLFENLLVSLESAPTSEIEAAEVLGLSFGARVLHIYIPNAFLLIVANVNSAFELNYKVVIAAEVLGRVSIASIGSNILAAKQSLDFSRSFTWLVVSVVMTFVLDSVGARIYKAASSIRV